MAYDFLGSVAQEDVEFQTEIVRVANVGENYYKLALYVEKDRFIVDPTLWTAMPGIDPPVEILTVDKDTYASVTKGLLKSWLQDFFGSGHSYDCVLVNVCDTYGMWGQFEDDALAYAYENTKEIAYFKSACMGYNDRLDPEAGVALAKLCAVDKTLLSAAPSYPYTTDKPQDPRTDPLVSALMDAHADAHVVAYQDWTRNAALMLLGLAFRYINGSGTVIGTNMDNIATSAIGFSGKDGAVLPKTIRNVLDQLNIVYFKPLGNTTGYSVARGAKTLFGEYVQANWIVNYINFMAKIRVSEFITRPNVLRNQATYQYILFLLLTELNKFGEGGSGRLNTIAITAPSFNQLPASAGDTLVVPDAWQANYVDQCRKVRVYGKLIIQG